MTELKRLRTKKGRDELNLFIIEGEKFVAEIPTEYAIARYAVTQKFATTHDLRPYEARARVEVVRDSLFAALADTKTPQGIMAICEKIPRTLDEILQSGASGNSCAALLLGENINDPGNVGTLIRTAAASGASGAIFTRGSCSLYSPKVIRAAAGAVFRLPVMADACADETFAALHGKNVKIFAADPRGEALPYELNLRENFCFVIGSEAHGISTIARATATATVRLPMARETESLNAAVAGSIFLYEALRQRMLFVPGYSHG